MAQKLKQTEDELKLIKYSEHKGNQELTSFPEEKKSTKTDKYISAY